MGHLRSVFGRAVCDETMRAFHVDQPRDATGVALESAGNKDFGQNSPERTSNPPVLR
jgi:hypothetical protein